MVLAGRLIRGLLVVGVCGFMCSCMTYGQPVVDDSNQVVYIPWAKRFFGAAQNSGVLLCVPKDTHIACVDEVRMVDSLPPIVRRPTQDYRNAPASGGYTNASPMAAASVAQSAVSPAGGSGNASALQPTTQAQSNVQAQSKALEPAVECTSGRIEFGIGQDEQSVDMLRCWSGKKVHVACHDKTSLRGTFIGMENFGTPSIKLWVVGGMKSRPLSEVSYVELQ